MVKKGKRSRRKNRRRTRRKNRRRTRRKNRRRTRRKNRGGVRDKSRMVTNKKSARRAKKARRATNRKIKKKATTISMASLEAALPGCNALTATPLPALTHAHKTLLCRRVAALRAGTGSPPRPSAPRGRRSSSFRPIRTWPSSKK